MQTNQTNKQKNCNAKKLQCNKNGFSVVVVVVGAASLDLP